MAAIDLGMESSGRKLERMLLGCALLAVAVVEAANGRGQAVFAGALAALALYLLASHHYAALDRRQKSILAAADFFAVAALAALCDPSGVLWRAPTSIESLFLLTPSGVGTAVFIYLAGSVGLTGRSPLAIRAALFALPFLFCLLIALGSPVAIELGRAALLGFEAPEFVNTVVGRVLVLFLVNEAVVVGAPLALGRFLPREWRPHGVLFLAALYAAVTPYIATAVSSYVTPRAPAPIAQIAAVLAAALAQAGLWGETYLVTQSLAGLLRGSASLSVIVFGDWKSGAEKGLVYGLVFMGLLLGANLILGFTPAVAVINATGPLGAAILGALLFPLARAIVESTDSTPPFCAKLEFRARRRGWSRGLAGPLSRAAGLERVRSVFVRRSRGRPGVRRRRRRARRSRTARGAPAAPSQLARLRARNRAGRLGRRGHRLVPRQRPGRDHRREIPCLCVARLSRRRPPGQRLCHSPLILQMGRDGPWDGRRRRAGFL
jgi:cyclic beta-1,2-glucan synthetase